MLRKELRNIGTSCADRELFIGVALDGFNPVCDAAPFIAGNLILGQLEREPTYSGDKNNR